MSFPGSVRISILMLRFFTLFLLLAVIGFCVLSGIAVSAEVDAVRQDTDKDGKIDQVAFFDKEGRPVRLEIDSNGDGAMDRVQHYSDGKVVKIERDTDHDKRMDTWIILRRKKGFARRGIPVAEE